jgi:hypothetical protein
VPVMLIEPKRWSPKRTYTRPRVIEWMDEGYEPCGQCGERCLIWAYGPKGSGFYPCARCGGLGRRLRFAMLLRD